MFKSFKVYINRVMKSMNENLHITSESISIIDSICRTISLLFVNKAVILLQNNSKKTITSSELEMVSKMILPENLCTDAIAFANNCIKNYNISLIESAESKRSELSTTETSSVTSEFRRQTMRETKAGLIFSVSLCEKYIRLYKKSFNVKKCAPVFLASILEAFTRHCLKLASVVTFEKKKVTINQRFLFLALQNDPQIKTFLDSMNIVILESGVIPENIVVKKQKQRVTISENSKDNEEIESKKRRWRQGTKTVFEIRKLQKSYKNLIQKAPFVRIVKEIVLKYFEVGMCRFTKDFLKIFQNFIENKVIEFMNTVNKVALHTGRETVYEKDIDFVWIMFFPKIKKRQTELENKLPIATVKQLALRSGIKRIGDNSINPFCEFIYSSLIKYINEALICSKYHKTQTLNLNIFIEILSMNNLHISCLYKKRKIKREHRLETIQEEDEIPLLSTE